MVAGWHQIRNGKLGQAIVVAQEVGTFSDSNNEGLERAWPTLQAHAIL